MSSLLVFPGQGAQRAGMLQALPDHVLEEASDALGEDVSQLDSVKPWPTLALCNSAC